MGPFALIGRARGDLDRLKTVLESYGFYQSYVGITIDGLPLDDPDLGEELTQKPGNDAKVKITFSLGPLYHLRKIEIDGEIPEGAREALQLIPANRPSPPMCSPAASGCRQAWRIRVCVRQSRSPRRARGSLESSVGRQLPCRHR